MRPKVVLIVHKYHFRSAEFFFFQFQNRCKIVTGMFERRYSDLKQ